VNAAHQVRHGAGDDREQVPVPKANFTGVEG